MTIINESLEYMDMKGQIIPTMGIDQYKSKLGDDSDFITLDLIVKSQLISDDLVIWLERGYDWVIDADQSPGEISNSRYVVFVELNRRHYNATNIIEIITDLETLTGLKLEDWQLKIGNELYPASLDIIKDLVPLSPKEYDEEEMEDDEILDLTDISNDDFSIDTEIETSLNEWRSMAGLDEVNQYYDKRDESIYQIQRQAGLI